LPSETFKIKGQLYTAFTSTATYQDVSINLTDYPIDAEGYPKAPANTETFFFQIGSGWYETTPQHRSPDQVQITGNVFTGQNFNIQTQLTPFTYGQTYLNRYRDFPYMNEGFKLQKVVDNNKSWLSDDDRIRISTQGDYNAYYYVDNEKLVLNVKNVDIFLNPAQGILYDVWVQSRQYDYPIPESGLTVDYSSPVTEFSTFSLLSEPMDYSVPTKVDFTYINPEPKKKTFFEFSQTFWENMINTRNRLYITDGKTGGYPTLQSIFWKYIESEQTVGLPNNKYTYQKLIDYVNGIGPYWTKLVEQMVPASTIWNGGVRLENSVLNKQKFVYRRQRGCQFIPVPVEPCFIISNIFDYTCNSEYADFNIYPWFNGDVTVSNFSSILGNRINNMLAQSGLTLNQCYENSVLTDWFVDLTINGEEIIKESFYTGYGITDVPTNTQWRNALINYLPQLYNYGYTYYLNGNTLTITNLTCLTQNMVDTVSLNVGINISINCTE
jgi:hypothetical protein